MAKFACIYISKFGKIFHFLGPTPAPMGVIFGVEESTFSGLLCAKHYPSWCSMSPLLGEKS